MAANLQSQTFRSFEIYIVVTLIYLSLSLSFSALFSADPPRRLPLSRSALRSERHVRTFGTHDFLFILQAAQWTIAAVADRLRGRRPGRAGRRAGAHPRQPAPARPATGFIQVFQGTPLLMQLFLVFFGAPMLGLDINPWIAAGVALTLNASAFLGEIWRGCIEAVPRDSGKPRWRSACTTPRACAT